MNPFRGDVLIIGLLLALPVIGLGLRGDFTVYDVLTRTLWCLGAAWVAVTILRWAATPFSPAPPKPSPTPDPLQFPSSEQSPD